MTNQESALTVRNPPGAFIPTLHFLGPGFILSAAVVGSGELIATTALGEGWKAVFMVCAFTVLLSTLFSNTAGFTRLWADMLGICRLVNANNERIRLRIVAVMSWLLPAIWSLVYVIFQKPLYLVIFMGISNALFLLVVAYQALIFRYRHTEQRLRPSPMFDVALWLSILSISFMAWRAARSVIN